MLEEAENKYTQDTYTDEATGLSVPYNIFVPDGYSLEQGWGGIVWATDAVQSVQKCIVVTLVFPDTVIDDNSGSYIASFDYGYKLECVRDWILSH